MSPSTRSHIDRVLTEVFAERERQHAKWGEQNWPDGTGVHEGQVEAAIIDRKVCQDAFAAKVGTYCDILREEVSEAFAEKDPAKLRAELVQVAAVAVAWVEKIDRDTAKPDLFGCDVCGWGEARHQDGGAGAPHAFKRARVGT